MAAMGLPETHDLAVREALGQVVRVCPAVAEALLTDAQGVLVERFGAGPVDAEELAVETLAAIPALGRTAAAARIGRPVEWLLVGERGTVVVRRLGALELFLVLRVPAGEWVGRARFAARTVGERLARLLS
jgi:predicted regulator of Ras-like GTPase activity (Roadblock/LC7/MglB family)